MTLHTPPSSFISTDMTEIASTIAARHNVQLSEITKRGKLTKALTNIRQEAIQAVHSTGRYARQDLAKFFHVSVCTISSSLTEQQKAKSRPFTEDEDLIISREFKAGTSIPKITSQLNSRSPSSVFRRLRTLSRLDDSLVRFPQPSYKGEVSKRWIQMARVENYYMRLSFDL